MSATPPAPAHRPEPAPVRQVLPRVVARLGVPHTRLALASPRSAEVRALSRDADATATARHRARSRVLSATVATAAHTLAVLLAFVIVCFPTSLRPPVITVASETSDPLPPQAAKKTITPPRASRPTTRNNPIPTITTQSPAPAFLPDTKLQGLEPMDLGSDGLGIDLGFGSPGLGGAQFLGLAAGRDTRHVVLLIDVSYSMRGNLGPDGLEAIRREVAKTVNSLAPGVLFNLYTFASDADGFSPRSVHATADKKAEAVAFFNGYFRPTSDFDETRTSEFDDLGVDSNGISYVPFQPENFNQLRDLGGSTRVELGVIAAMQNRPQVIYVISDGEPLTTRRGRPVGTSFLLNTIDAEYRRLYNGSGLRINTISIDGQGASFLKKLARQFTGAYKDVRRDDL